VHCIKTLGKFDSGDHATICGVSGRVALVIERPSGSAIGGFPFNDCCRLRTLVPDVERLRRAVMPIEADPGCFFIRSSNRFCNAVVTRVEVFEG